MVANFILGQQSEMVSRFAHRIGPVLVRTRSNVGLAADYRLDAGAFCFLIKFNRAKKIAVIGHGHGRHLEFLRFFHQLLHPNRSVEQRILSMQMKMNERIARHAFPVLNGKKISQIYEACHSERRIPVHNRKVIPRDLSTSLRSAQDDSSV